MVRNMIGAGCGRALRATLIGLTLATVATVTSAADYKILVPAAPGGEFRHYVDAEQKAVFKLVNDLELVKK